MKDKYFIGFDDVDIHSKYFEWQLPKNDIPGEWIYARKSPIPGANLIYIFPLSSNIMGKGLREFLFRVEGGDPSNNIFESMKNDPNSSVKVGYKKARILYRVLSWNMHTALSFACDCAERALYFVEKDEITIDPIAHRAIQIGRCLAKAAYEYANEVNLEDMNGRMFWIIDFNSKPYNLKLREEAGAIYKLFSQKANTLLWEHRAAELA